MAEREEVPSEGYRSKLRHGARACRNGVARAHIIDGSVGEPLLRELFSNEGIATMVYYPRALHQQPCFAELPAASCPIAEQWTEEALALPMGPGAGFPGVGQDHVIDRLRASLT